MSENIIIVDNFYEDPDKIRSIALSASYPTPESTYTYPGKNSTESYYPDDVHAKFESILRTKLLPADQNGYFRLSLQNDVHKQDIHVDPTWKWGAVIYLTDPAHCVPEGGTSFWRHNTLQMDSCPKTSEEAEFYGYSCYEEARLTIVYEEGLDRSKWTRYLLCPMKYNRLILFKTYLWHSHNYNFGTDLNDGRLVQLFFFK